MEPIKDLLDEAKRRGFRPTGKPYLDIKTQGGWVVNGIADFKKYPGGSGHTNTGWVFASEADANNFYNVTAALSPTKDETSMSPALDPTIPYRGFKIEPIQPTKDSKEGLE